MSTKEKITGYIYFILLCLLCMLCGYIDKLNI
nr:MAG TPA: type VI secretion protein [Caudoviricetes sp.]